MSERGQGEAESGGFLGDELEIGFGVARAADFEQGFRQGDAKTGVTRAVAQHLSIKFRGVQMLTLQGQGARAP